MSTTARTDLARAGGSWWDRARGTLARAAGWKARAPHSGYGGGDGTQSRGTWVIPGANSPRDPDREAGSLWKNSAVAICLGWVRKNFPEPRLRMERWASGAWADAPDHPVLEWLEEPNPDYDDDTLWAATCLSLLVDGNAYWLVERDAVGRPYYWFMPHYMVEPRWPTSGAVYISHYEYTVDGKRVRLPTENVVHYRQGLDPDNERKGFTELKACTREVCTDNEANVYTAALLRNLGIPGVIITPESPTDEIDDKERKILEDTFQRKFTGENRGRPMVNSVSLRVTKLGMSPQDMVIDKLRQIPEARICAAIGIPAMVVGLSVGAEGRTFSNLGEANRHAYHNCLIPLQKTIAKQYQRHAAMTADMQTRRAERLGWDYTDVQALQEDLADMTRRLVTATGGPVMTVNEGRSRLGLKPLPDAKHDEIRERTQHAGVGQDKAPQPPKDKETPP